MKTSAYNYILYKNGYSYWFNGISKSFFRLSESLGRKMEDVINNPDKLVEHESIIGKFINGGFVINKNIDELNHIRKMNEESINKQNYFLIILPTLNCNFSCWYCIQDHVQSVMSLETIEKVKRHIDKIIFEERITELHIEWFGGEPFMNFKEVIEPISKYAIEKCKNANIPFLNAATTNGYYLDSKLNPKLQENMFKRFHITLDGPRDSHNKIKFQNGLESAFDRTLENINNILNFNKESSIILRINYTRENLNEEIVNQVSEHIKLENRNRVLVILKKVWQENATGLTEKLELVRKQFKKCNFTVQELDVIYDFIPCYANRKNYLAVNYNGSVVKCTAHDDLYSKNPPGKLNDDGSVSWREDFLSKFNKKRFENDRCLKCKHLPLCMGICSRDYDKENEKELYYCKMKSQTFSIESQIVNFIDSNYQ
jgi:radical SAM additional 4Fe4S-binding domain